MKPRIILLCLPILLLIASISQGQTNQPSTQQDNIDKNSGIIYTGKLLGYFRVPSVQKFDEVEGCNPKSEKPSEAAEAFLKMLDSQRKTHPNVILVGTGDNFAPEVEARMFSEPEERDGQYPAANKEFFFGKPKGWIFYEDLKKPENKNIKLRIQQGLGTIPTDNVGCFLRAAKYAAIVPGKHDFYFGAERLRQFARLLATPAEPKAEFQPVQMLGANLVIATDSIKSKTLDSKIPENLFQEWPKTLPVSNLSDGKLVYPWFSFIKIPLITLEKNKNLIDKLVEAKKNGPVTFDVLTSLSNINKAKVESPGEQELKLLFENATQAKSIKLCGAKRPNEISTKKEECQELPYQVTWSDNQITLTLTLPDRYKGRPLRGSHPEPNHHFSTLLPGHNFGLCLDLLKTAEETKKDREANKSGRGCMRFATYTPLFTFPHDVAKERESDGVISITDPEPFVVTENNVAIFGVVDPNLNDQVGALNYGWKNLGEGLTTRVNAEDPKEALSEQLDYFKRLYPDFNGLKVLLVQATPQRAKALAANFADFQIVVSAADQAQGTNDVAMSTTWKSGARAGNFLTVPTPYYDPVEKKGKVTYGLVTGTHDEKYTTWTLSSVVDKPVVASSVSVATGGDKPAEKASATENSQKQPVGLAKEFWQRVKQLPTCKPSDFKIDDNENTTNQTFLKLLALCSLRDQMGADVALIQSRDFFDDQTLDESPLRLKLMNRKGSPDPNNHVNPNNPVNPNDPPTLNQEAQMMIDRLLWKGDLATLLIVPGSALKKALKQSEAYASEETSSFALGVEKGRTLEKLGVKKDNNEYFINGLPIDDKKTYSVATTDYIGAGDTGYPDLVKEALNPRTQPSAFTGKLVPLSSLVCRNVITPDKDKNNQEEKQPNFNKYCLPSITSDDYLDETIASQTPPHEEQSLPSRLWDATAIALPKQAEDATTTAGVVEQKVQRRAFWLFSLKNASLGFSDLDNNHMDDDLANRFKGVPESQVAAKEERDYTIGIDTRLSYFAYRRELFFNFVIDYERNSLGDPETEFTVSQKKNRMYGDLGYVFWRRFGREQPNIGLVFSVHGDTQFDNPFSTFTLGNSITGAKENDKIKISQGRSFLLLGRLGARWQNKTNTFEIGVEGGRDLQALRGFSFENGGLPVECVVDLSPKLSDCVSAISTPATGPVTKEWNTKALQQGRMRMGLYWNHTLSIPFTERLKYVVTQDADWFFVKFHRDTSIDTKFRYSSKNRLEFMIWPTLSIGPTLDLFLFENKRNNDWLFQRQLGLKINFSFDLINWRERIAQAKHKS